MGANRAPTLEATGRLLRRYQAGGYRFVTIPEMMKAAKPARPKTGGAGL